MTPDNESRAEPTLFSAVLTPHRSLGTAGFMLVMLVVGGINFVAGLVFFLAGAWPVVGFLGLDVALLYWAFRASYRSASAYEQVTITASELLVRKVSHRGKIRDASHAKSTFQNRQYTSSRRHAIISWLQPPVTTRHARRRHGRCRTPG